MFFFSPTASWIGLPVPSALNFPGHVVYWFPVNHANIRYRFSRLLQVSLDEYLINLDHHLIKFCSLLCITHGLLRHGHDVLWPMYQHYFVQEASSSERCQMPMLSSKSLEKVLSCAHDILLGLDFIISYHFFSKYKMH